MSEMNMPDTKYFLSIFGNPNNSDWTKAVNIFLDRMYGRFMTPIKAAIKHRDSTIREFSSFVIIAIDCLLIETLNQFYEGLNETPRKKHPDAFWNFFQQSKHFQGEFDEQLKSDTFYDHFR